MVDKKIGVVSSVLIITLMMIVLVMAATVVRNPLAANNYSGTFNVSVNSTIPNVVNVTIYYNESGGPVVLSAANYFYVINSSSNTTPIGLVIENSSVNIAGLNDSLTYNFTFIVTNTTKSKENHSVANVVIDNTLPKEVNITGTETRGNYTGSITLNASVLDALSGVESVVFNVTNSSGIQNGTVTGTKSGDYYSVSLDTSQYPDGTYNITVFAYDYASNLNNTKLVHTVKFDNTNPTASVSCTPDPINAGATVTCTCSITDDTSGVNVTSKSHDTTPSTSDTGTFTNSCSFADNAGNTGSASTTYTVELSGSSGGGGGGSSSTPPTSFYVRTINIATKDFSEVQTIQQKLAAKERIRVKFDNDYHHIGVRELTLTTALIEVASHGVLKQELGVGEEINGDFNDDNVNDVNIKLNSIINGKADLNIKYIQESYVDCIADWDCGNWSECADSTRTRTCTDLNECHDKDPWSSDDSKPIESEACEEAPEEGMSLMWIWIIIGIIVLAVVYYSVKRK